MGYFIPKSGTMALLWASRAIVLPGLVLSGIEPAWAQNRAGTDIEALNRHVVQLY
jgi:hypothetical protein